MTWPGADAGSARITKHKEGARAARAHHRKAACVQELCEIDSSAARSAIKDLADDADDLTAATAMQALCREDFRGARTKLKAIFEDDDRSDAARSVAILALLHRRAKDGKSWSECKGYVRTHTEAGDDIRAAAKAAAAKLWPSEVDSE